MDNHSLIEKIKKENGEKELKEIYNLYRNEFLSWAVRNYSCSDEDAKEVFQQVMVIFYENIIVGKVTEITTQVKTYLFSIGKNKIQELLRMKTRRASYSHDDYLMNTEHFYGDEEDNYEETVHKVNKRLEELGDPCKSILVQYYYHRRNMQEIAEKFNYKNSDTVKNLKYKCLQRLKKICEPEFQAFNIDSI